MHLIIDATPTQNQYKDAGIGVFARNTIEEIIKLEKYEIDLLLYNSITSLDKNLIYKPHVNIIQLGKLRNSNYFNLLTFYTYIYPHIKRVRRKDSIYYTPYVGHYFPIDMKAVGHIHDFTPAILGKYTELNRFFNLLKELEYWLFMGLTTKLEAITCNLDHTTEQYLKYYPDYNQENVFKVELGLDTNVPTLSTNPNIVDKYIKQDWRSNGYIIYMGGNVAQSKNSKTVINAYKKFIERTNSTSYLVITGKNFIDHKKTVKHINKLNLKDRVLFIGSYDDEDKIALLKNSIVFINLSLYEGFGLTLLEAMYSKTPIIASDIYPYRYLTQNNAYLVSPYDIDSIVELLQKVVIRKDYPKDYINYAYTRSMKFQWKNIGKIYDRIFNKIS